MLSNAHARVALSLRLQPLSAPAEATAELHAIYLKALAGHEGAAAAWEGAARQLLLEFNANVPYSGPCLPCLRKWERLVPNALVRLIRFGKSWLPPKATKTPSADAREAAIAVLGTMRRLLATRPGIEALVAQTEQQQLKMPDLATDLVSYAWTTIGWPNLEARCAARSREIARARAPSTQRPSPSLAATAPRRPPSPRR